jgi:hypothetical protein
LATALRVAHIAGIANDISEPFLNQSTRLPYVESEYLSGLRTTSGRSALANIGLCIRVGFIALCVAFAGVAKIISGGAEQTSAWMVVAVGILAAAYTFRRAWLLANQTE